MLFGGCLQPNLAYLGETESGGENAGGSTSVDATSTGAVSTSAMSGTATSGGGSESSGSSSGEDSSSSGSESSTGGQLPMLDVLRLEIPCMGTANCGMAYCDTVGTASAMQTLVGEDGVTYETTLWIRGVFEQKTYLGGTTDGYWNDGGTPQVDDWNTLQLEISDPPQLYYLNAGSTGNPYCDPLDYTQPVPVRAGATLTVTMFDTTNCGAYNVDADGNPIVIDDIPPAPEPFDGQFVQIDALTIVPLR